MSIVEEKWSPQAERDLREILKFILENWDQKIADRFLRNLRASIDRIKLHPTRNPLFRPDNGIRKYIVDSYNELYYQVSNDTIDILRIFPSRSDPAKLKL